MANHIKTFETLEVLKEYVAKFTGLGDELQVKFTDKFITFRKNTKLLMVYEFKTTYQVYGHLEEMGLAFYDKFPFAK